MSTELYDELLSTGLRPATGPYDPQKQYVLYVRNKSSQNQVRIQIENNGVESLDISAFPSILNNVTILKDSEASKSTMCLDRRLPDLEISCVGAIAYSNIQLLTGSYSFVVNGEQLVTSQAIGDVYDYINSSVPQVTIASSYEDPPHTGYMNIELNTLVGNWTWTIDGVVHRQGDPSVWGALPPNDDDLFISEIYDNDGTQLLLLYAVDYLDTDVTNQYLSMMSGYTTMSLTPEVAPLTPPTIQYPSLDLYEIDDNSNVTWVCRGENDFAIDNDRYLGINQFSMKWSMIFDRAPSVPLPVFELYKYTFDATNDDAHLELISYLNLTSSDVVDIDGLASNLGTLITNSGVSDLSLTYIDGEISIVNDSFNKAYYLKFGFFTDGNMPEGIYNNNNEIDPTTGTPFTSSPYNRSMIITWLGFDAYETPCSVECVITNKKNTSSHVETARVIRPLGATGNLRLSFIPDKGSTGVILTDNSHEYPEDNPTHQASTSGEVSMCLSDDDLFITFTISEGKEW